MSRPIGLVSPLRRSEHFQEITRRASDVSIADVGNININKLNDKRRDSNLKRDSVDHQRRGSIRRGSTAGDDDDLEKRKMRAVLEMMGMQRKTQKSFTWDSNAKDNQEKDEKPKRYDNAIVLRKTQFLHKSVSSCME